MKASAPRPRRPTAAPTPEPKPATRRPVQTLWFAALLLLLVGIAYSPVLRCGFLNFDDNFFVTENPHVHTGLKWANIRWAFAEPYRSNWVPLAWISHMTDSQLFGLAPWGHHLFNLIFHAANVLLFFSFVHRATRQPLAALLASGLFGLHPIHAESVAWVAERRDVLSTLFWLLTCHAYLRYGAAPSVRRYAAVFGLFALGLLSKSMLVTLPFVLLLLDLWPLRRFKPASPSGASKRASWLPVLLEKIPLLFLAAAASIITFLAQRGGGAVDTLAHFSIRQRVANALVSYAVYLRKLVVPAGFPVFEPHPRYALNSPEVVAAQLVLAVITAVIVAQFGRRPYLVTGWFWYLGTLVPVIGLVQVGSQGLAYRYTYIPFLGIYLALGKGLGDLLASGVLKPRLVAGAGAALLCALAALTWRQTNYWRTNESLYEYSLKWTKGNWPLQNNLGVLYMARGDFATAAQHLEQAVHSDSCGLEAIRNFGFVLQQLGRNGEAVDTYKRCLAVNRDQPKVYYNLILALMAEKRLDEADSFSADLLELEPNRSRSHVARGTILMAQGKSDEAIQSLQKARALEPDDSQTLYHLGNAYHQVGQPQKALELLDRKLDLPRPQQINRYILVSNSLRELQQFDKATEVLRDGFQKFPDSVDLLEQLAYLEYTQVKDLTNAYVHLQELLRLSPNHPQRGEYRAAIEYLAPKISLPASQTNR